MENQISINKFLLTALIVAAILIGATGSYFYTSNQYEIREEAQLQQDEELDTRNLICEARVQRGKTGEVKSEFFIFERSAEESDCSRYIEYKNIPEDTESVWMGF